VLAPDRDVRPFQSVLIDLGARLKLPGFATPDGAPKYPGGYQDYIVNHERRPGIGPLAGYRGKDGAAWGRGAPNPRQLEQYVADGCVHVHELPTHMRYFKHANRAFIDWAVDMGFRITPTPVIFQLYSEPMQKMRLAARGTVRCCLPASIASASRPTSTRCPFGTRPSRMRLAPSPAFRCTPLPSGRWRCTIHGVRRTPGCGRSIAATVSI
jgi:hypothetical protein